MPILTLKELSFDFIKTHLRPDNVIQLYQETYFLEDVDFRRHCFEMIDKNAQHIITSHQLVTHFDRKLFYNVLKRNTFCAREIDIFEALIRWAKVNLPDDSQSTNNIREFLGGLLFLVRFPQMTMKTILSRVATTNLLVPAELMEALIHTMNKKDQTIATTLFPSTVRSLGNQFVLKRSDFPSDANGSDFRMEPAIGKGFRVMRFQVANRLFIKSVGISNVPYRWGGHHLRITVQDREANELVKAAEYMLTCIHEHPLVPATYTVCLEPMVEVCPLVNYEVRFSIEKPGFPDRMMARVTDAENVALYFNYCGSVSKDEVVIEELNFSS